MLVVISPAKRLDWQERKVATTNPDFDREANILAGHARALSLTKLRGLMDLSDDLARLNRERFKAFSSEPDESATRPAALAFAGDTYQGLEAASLDTQSMDWAQNHLRILSGLYGLLRPLDAIQPYRLEMGSRLKTRRGATLYDFWGAEISKALNNAAEVVGSNDLVNCASQEYFGAVDRKKLKPRIITPIFLEERNGAAKTVSFFAKKARGAMARFIVENRVTDAEGIKDFDLGGYSFDPSQSQSDTWVFSRPYPEGVPAQRG